MATKNVNWKVMIWLAGALITVGGLIATIRYDSERIGKVEIKSHTNEGDIRELKTDIKYIRSGIDEIKRDVKK